MDNNTIVQSKIRGRLSEKSNKELKELVLKSGQPVLVYLPKKTEKIAKWREETIEYLTQKIMRDYKRTEKEFAIGDEICN